MTEIDNPPIPPLNKGGKRGFENGQILVLQHVDYEGLGYFEEPLQKARFDIHTIKLYENDKIPDVLTYKALIILGGYMNVYQEDKFPFLAAENSLIKRCIELRKPYLGICLGAQLLAKALGAKVYPNKIKEIGFYEIQPTEHTNNDPLLSGLPDALEVFQWHGDTFDLPDGTKLLATSEVCVNQAFSYDNAYGIQFHLETTPEMISEWSNLYKEELLRFGSLKIKSERALTSRPYAELTIKNFIEIINT